MVQYPIKETKKLFPITLARLVDFPTPLTPQNVSTNGRFSSLALSASCNTSICLLGDNICTNDSSILERTTD